MLASTLASRRQNVDLAHTFKAFWGIADGDRLWYIRLGSHVVIICTLVTLSIIFTRLLLLSVLRILVALIGVNNEIAHLGACLSV